MGGPLMRRRLIFASFCLLTLSKRPNEDTEAAEARDPRPCEVAYGAHQCLMVGGLGGLISVRRGRLFIIQ